MGKRGEREWREWRSGCSRVPHRFASGNRAAPLVEQVLDKTDVLATSQDLVGTNFVYT